jgi:hypothetical protein
VGHKFGDAVWLQNWPIVAPFSGCVGTSALTRTAGVSENGFLAPQVGFELIIHLLTAMLLTGWTEVKPGVPGIDYNLSVNRHLPEVESQILCAVGAQFCEELHLAPPVQGPADAPYGTFG